MTRASWMASLVPLYLSSNPSRKASSPFTLLPVKMRSFAFAAPTSRGSLCVPPAPGMIASLVSGSPTTASWLPTLKSHARASSNPPPSAMPSSAAIVGTGILCIAWKALLSLRT
eukprot:CAMPEP_0197482526 /NCGR_PEP_ID=MMETSP1309-20131121/55989_1 /TAXON_ID=464262 /ORGANISM="Genus nov. species nov., Strain RCC998" /LENGTH=113 /DNA_ID=CAMNT_0043025045 /DNA_START=71 /DNA_END=412 /DNA_ORIENTATION=-